MLTVNLTTTCQRLALCRIALVSLILQTRLPERINVWVSQEPYLRDRGIDDVRHVAGLVQSLPASGRALVNIRWVPNTGPYRKLIPMLREAGADDVIVTADDDIFYHQRWLSRLLEAFDPSRNIAVAARVRLVRVNPLGRKTSYLYWPLMQTPAVVKSDYVVTFGGGAVLTRAMFQASDIADDAFINIAPTADDLWYSKLLRRKNTPVSVVPDLLDALYFIRHEDGLNKHNFPAARSLLHKMKIRFWNRHVGYWGLPVCDNDKTYRRIDRYFR